MTILAQIDGNLVSQMATGTVWFDWSYLSLILVNGLTSVAGPASWNAAIELREKSKEQGAAQERAQGADKEAL